MHSHEYCEHRAVYDHSFLRVEKHLESDWSIFFILKNRLASFLFLNFLEFSGFFCWWAPLAGFERELHDIHALVKQIEWLHIQNRFVYTLFRCLNFSLRCFFVSLICNCQISNAIFCIIVFWHCSDCVHMCITQLFVRFLAWFLAFWHCVYIRLFS